MDLSIKLRTASGPGTDQGDNRSPACLEGWGWRRRGIGGGLIKEEAVQGRRGGAWRRAEGVGVTGRWGVREFRAAGPDMNAWAVLACMSGWNTVHTEPDIKLIARCRVRECSCSADAQCRHEWTGVP